MKVTNKEIFELDNGINVLTTKGVPGDTVLKVLGLKDEITGHVENYRKAFKQIMSDFNIELVNEGYNWSEREDKEEISQKVTELVNAEVELEGANQYELNEVLGLTTGLTVGQITAFKKYLLKA